MSVFTLTNGTTLSDAMIDDIETMVLVREPDRLDELPRNFSVITGEMLGYSNSSEGHIDSQGYYHAGIPALGGQAIAILQDDGTIAISFRGTSDALDLTSIASFPGNNYIYGFDEWLASVAKFAKENDYEIDLVTGKSLGGACVNMLRDTSNNIAGGAYSDAIFFAVASPLIASNSNNLLNYGYNNDYAHEWYEENLVWGSHNEASVTDNLVYYDNDYARSNWSGFMNFSSHTYNAFSRGVDALQDTIFANEMTRDSFAILAETTKIKVGTAISRSDVNTNDAYIISVNDNRHIIYGANTNDHIELGSARDTVYAGNGNDVIYSQGGNDIIKAGNGNDYINGGGGADKIEGNGGNDEIHAGHGHDLVYGGWGDDEIYGDHWNDRLYGGRGQDELTGGWGNDALWGGQDADIFVFDAKGHDVIYDFELGLDKLKLDDDIKNQYTIYDFENAATVTSSGDLYVKINNQKSLLIQDVSIAELNVYSDFLGLDHWADAVFIG